MGPQALQGIKVADFSWVGVGPVTTKYLADHGSTVVRVESSLRPDGLRSSAPFKEGTKGVNRSGYFACINSNKYSIAIDLNNEQGRDVAKRLVMWADVVAESFTPGRMEAWGLGYDDLVKINDGVIMLRMNSHGLTGPFSRHISFGHQLVGVTGFSSATGWPDRDVAQPYGAYTDWLAPRLFVSALLAAIDQRRRTGKGQCLDCSQTEAALQFIAPYLLDYTVNQRVALRQGNASPCAAPHGVFRCLGEDRWCAIGVFSEEQWRALVKAMGDPSWAQQARFATLALRKENEPELDRLVEAWTSQAMAEELMARLQEAGIPAGVVSDARDVYDDIQLKYRDHLWKAEHQELGPFSHLGQTFKLSKTPSSLRLPAPCLGEHTHYVCTEFLGMSDPEVLALMDEGVLV